MVNILLGVLLVVGPLAGYFLGGHSTEGLLVGLALACFVLVVYFAVDKIPLDVLVFGGIGAGGGLIAAKVLDWFVYKLDNPIAYSFMYNNISLVYMFLGILGALVAMRKKSELDLLDKDIVVKGGKNSDVVVLDTSVLIDGRISEVAETGFLSGRILVPKFVLEELQTVADSSDSTKRQRGRRGLDILKLLQEMDGIQMKVYEKDFPQVREVDAKVIQLAKDLGGRIATTDFNMNKVAALQGVQVLNINDLAAALKSVVLPGDTIPLFLAKEGKEKAQAVGYLDDGTMIVVEDARKLIGKRIQVHVNSILQTSAGRMIFARVHDSKDQAVTEGDIDPGSGMRTSNA